MNTERRWQDKYGSYQLVARDDFLESRVIGSIGEEITAKFFKDIIELAKSYGGRPFGYLADLRLSEGFNDVAERDIISAYKTCMTLGCVIDAMMLESPVVKQQMQRISDIVDVPIPLEVRLFDERSKAVAFIEKIIRKEKDK